MSSQNEDLSDASHHVVKRQIDDRRVVCYYANWAVYRQGTAKFSPQNINPYLCTHLIYAFAGLGKDDTIQTFDKYQDLEKGKKRYGSRRHLNPLLLLLAKEVFYSLVRET